MIEVERLRRADEIVQAALERGGDGELSALLDEACGGDALLRAEVESLLGYRERVRGFIESPAYAVGVGLFSDIQAGDAEDVAGRLVGPYRIVREVGRGGMGAVFLAERADGEFRQQVALKVVRRSFADTELARRFRQERQILASLNHPNIARLLDGGVSSEGEPYLVMEYVEGVRVDDYCDRAGISTRARLRLFLEVCRAVAYAHQLLVVHRDIKPSNILVTDEGVPKLLDFGIAKLLDPEQAGEQTRTEMRAFTPDYAAPEQVEAGGQITTATDVYSLGVLLGDLLTGARRAGEAAGAFGGWRSETPGRTAATNLPTDQRGGRGRTRLRKSAGAELENIVAMARREDSARRYASAAELADDVELYLEGRPVRAQKDSLTYRAGKFVRRNKIAVAAATLVLLTLISGIVATLWQARRATREAAVAALERNRALRRFSDVRQLSNALLTDIAPKMERLQGSTEAREALVNQSLKYLDSLAGESADDLALQSELASAYEKTGDIQGAPRRPNLSDFSGALASYEKARAIRQRLADGDPNDADNLRLLAANYKQSASIRSWINDYSGAIRDSEAAISLYEKLISAQPDSVGLRLSLAEAELDLGYVHRFNNQYAKAYPYLQTAIASLEELRQTNPEDKEVLRLLVVGYTNLGAALSWDDRQKEGEAEMTKALTIIEPLAADNPNDAILRHWLWNTDMQASSLYEEVNNSLSYEFAIKALRVAEESVQRDGADTQARQNLAAAYSKVGVAAGNLKRLPEAISYCDKAIAAFTELERNEPKNLTYKRNLGVAYTRLGDAKYKQRDLPGSLAAFENSAALFELLAEADTKNMVAPRDAAQAYKNIGTIHRDLARTASAESHDTHLQAARENYQRALDILLHLQSQNALAGFDRKFLEEMKSAVQKYGPGN